MTFFNRNVSLTNTYHFNCFRVFTRRCRHWDPLNRNTGCLVALVTCVLHAENRFVVVVLWVVQHNVSHVDVGERMTTSKTGRPIYVHKRTLGSRGWVETLQPITTRQPCTVTLQPITTRQTRTVTRRYIVTRMLFLV